MKFALSELGDLRQQVEEESRAFRVAQWQALKALGDEHLKAPIRKDVEGSGLRNAKRLAKTWRGAIYPARPGRGARSPAYVLSNKVPYLIESFEKGGSIEGKGGALLVPIGEARKIRLPRGAPRSDLIEAVKAKFGTTLVSARLKTTRALALGVYRTDDSGRRRFLPLFLVRPKVKAPDLLNAEGLAKDGQLKVAAALPGEIERRAIAAVAARGGRR